MMSPDQKPHKTVNHCGCKVSQHSRAYFLGPSFDRTVHILPSIPKPNLRTENVADDLNSTFYYVVPRYLFKIPLCVKCSTPDNDAELMSLVSKTASMLSAIPRLCSMH